ncbi:hypothetical protein BAOM_3149 [Peribacillus asahii]|uniref:Uncharacterized protein n=1 Tax=Peribacillus asahii TaxID=228899 RepID=A0A3T0KTV6_9BACI|nr:hypothetical protein [Peribacillus asahii]AZV43758.1 hypothetical protein BAOM_3149 [Peribacillus asahii]
MSKLIKHGEEWVHTETGEVWTQKRLQEYNDKQMFENHNQYMKNAIEHDLKVKKKLTTIRESNETNRKTIKEGYKFNMIHRTDIKELLLSNKLTVQEFAFIGAFTPFITYPDNDIKINNEYFPLEDLAEFCGYSKNIMTRTIKKLEELEVIKVVKGGNRPPIIYFNPFLFSAGREISNDTYMMFCKSRYNPDVAHYC